jgi:hypothetical protein
MATVDLVYPSACFVLEITAQISETFGIEIVH